MKEHTITRETPFRAIPSTALTGHHELANDLFKRILIPLEIGCDPHALIGLAASLTPRYHSDVVVVQAMPNEAGNSSPGANPTSNLKFKLDAIEQYLRQHGAASVKTIIIGGNPSYLIEQIARDHAVTTILLSSESETAQMGAWFGTLPQRLAMRSSIPLLVMRPGATHAFKPLLCVVDFSESSRLALKNAVSIARVHQARLIILNVVPEPLLHPIVEGPIWHTGGFPAGHIALHPPMSEVINLQAGDHIAAAQLELHEYLQTFDLTGIEYEVRVTHGLPVVQTLSEARSRKAGLIVTGCSHRAGLIHLMSQSPAESLAETAEIPVLLFRSSIDPQPTAAS